MTTNPVITQRDCCLYRASHEIDADYALEGPQIQRLRMALISAIRREIVGLVTLGTAKQPSDRALSRQS
jgi:hypothetical protein